MSVQRMPQVRVSAVSPYTTPSTTPHTTNSPTPPNPPSFLPSLPIVRSSCASNFSTVTSSSWLRSTAPCHLPPTSRFSAASASTRFFTASRSPCAARRSFTRMVSASPTAASRRGLPLTRAKVAASSPRADPCFSGGPSLAFG